MLSQILSSTALLAGAALTAAPAAAAPSNLQIRDQRPIWTVAHKILTVDQLDAALDDQANAIEVDLRVWRKGDDGEDADKWWMSHDKDINKRGDQADVLLKAIGEKGGDQLSFVVLDIKTPDECEVDQEGCGIGTVVNMARDFVLSHGIGVVYGFISPKDADKDGFRYITENLGEDDVAVRITGAANPVLEAFDQFGGNIPTSRRIMDYGNPNLHGDKGGPKFGKCESADDSEDVCPNLVHAVEEEDNGNLASVMLWTVGSSDDDGDKTRQALDARINGVVYGFADATYDGSERNEKARNHIVNWVDDHSDIARIAAQDERPWA